MTEQTLEDVCTLIVDSEHKTAPTATLGTEFGYSIGTPHIRDGRILITSAIPVDQPTYAEWTVREIPRANDLILSREAPVGQVGRIEAGWKVCLRQRTVLLRPDPARVLPRYLLYVLLAPKVQERMQARAAGSTVPHLNIKEVRSLSVGIIPDLPEQQAIVDILGALDDKIAVNERTAETSIALAETLYIRDSKSEHEWHEDILANTAKWMSGGTPKTSEPSYWGGDIPWISAASLKSPWLDDSERRVTPLGAENGTRLVPAGTIIFVVRGMSLTSEFRVGLTQREVAFGQDCKALVPHSEIDPVVLFLALRSRSREILSLVDTAGHGTGRLGTDRIEKLRVRLPIGETRRAFTETVRPLAQLAASLQRENRALACLRSTLLPGLVSGMIPIKDALHAMEDAAS